VSNNFKENIFSGIWPAVLTPLTSESKINVTVLKDYLEVLIREGVSGLYIGGSTGQGIYLSVDERMKLAEASIQAVSGRAPVCIHVGANTTEESVLLAKHADSFGADVISSVGPVFFPVSTASIFKHYEAISGSVNTPFLAYHFDLTGSGLTCTTKEFCDRLLSMPNMVGLKYTSKDLHELVQLKSTVGDRLKIFSGSDELFCLAAIGGADGAIGSQFNLWSKQCSLVLEKLKAGDFELARYFSMLFMKVISKMSPNIWGFWVKAVEVKYGLDFGSLIAPLGLEDKQWSEDEVKEIVDMIDMVGIE